MDDEKKIVEEEHGIEDANGLTGDEKKLTEEDKNNLRPGLPQSEPLSYIETVVENALFKLRGNKNRRHPLEICREDNIPLFSAECKDTFSTPSEHVVEAAIGDLNAEELGLLLINVLRHEASFKNAVMLKLLQKNANVNVMYSDFIREHRLSKLYESDTDDWESNSFVGDFSINALYLAAEEGDLATVKILLHAGAVVNPLQCGRAIDVAALKGHEAVVRELLQAGADIQGQQNQSGVYSYSTLHFAAFGSNLEIVKLLVEKYKADIHALSSFGSTPLMAASMVGCVEVVEYLLKQGAAIDQQNQRGVTALYRAVLQSDTIDQFTSSQLLDAGAEDGFEDRRAFKKKQKFQTIQCLLSNKANVNLPNIMGDTAVFSALDCEAQARWKRSLLGQTEVHTPRIFQLLLDSGADIHVVNTQGETLLFSAIRHKQTDIVQWLLANGADIHVVNEQGETPLFSAIRNKQTDIVKWLLAHGADLNVENKRKETVFDVVETVAYHAEIIKRLNIQGSLPPKYPIEASTIKETVGNLLVEKQMEPLLWAFAYGDTLENPAENAAAPASVDVDPASVEEKSQSLPSPPPFVQFAQSDIVDLELVREVSKLLKHPPKP